MRTRRVALVIGAFLCLPLAHASAQSEPVGPPDKVVGSWSVQGALADGKPIRLDVRRHKITFSLFANGRWAMTVLEGRKVRSARGLWRTTGTGRYVLAQAVPSGPVDVLHATMRPDGVLALMWKAPAEAGSADEPGRQRAAVRMKLAAKLGPFTIQRASVTLLARQPRRVR